MLFLLAIVLSVRLRFTDSYYPFDIFKLFLDPYNLFFIEVSAERLNNAQSCNNLCVMSVNATCFYECSIVLWKGCTRLAVASDKVYQLLDHGRWFSPGTPASSTTKTGRHDIAEILLKVV